MDLDKLWPSALPVILIVFISWLFSFLGSKYKKTQPGSQAQAPAAKPKDEGDLLEKKILEFFGVADEVEKARQEQQTPGKPVNSAPPTRYGTSRMPEGPVTTPKPIEPKWWGA